ncbi:hypothetical protein IQ241_17525 [Romeria aff. gracilis LEGE 07310]|uniref:Protein kinase domain-containing protein n=1 Tax=Vasconcelosia minhoensis LEGE 07310 TaxID=915328 RepID=A0A8J7AH77_9CYAN|nr:hypothetical protein [Romeria gracilis]MBE9079076.1 hypothetical protein [Romeria aff. gracilis LEGE 07310]
MAENSIKIRKNKYFYLSSQIARMDNVKLRSLLDDGKSNLGWVLTHTIALRQSKVFVKRIPVTNLEYDNLFFTKNFYDLPTYFNYGLGSAGLGVAGLCVFRELVTHIKTTHWVLEEEVATFPLMYHYRIIPYSGPRINVDRERLKGFIEYWGNSVNAGRYMLDRANANYELILFLEHFPQGLEAWLLENPGKLQKPLEELHATLDFLRDKGIIHFDAHFRNVLTDGEQTYLIDFGLALDKNFALTKDEETFFEQNIYYDYGEVLRNLGHLIRTSYDLCPEEDKRRIAGKYGISEDLQSYELGSQLLKNVEQIHTDGTMSLDEFYVESIVKYRSIITLMRNFYFEIWGNSRKYTKLPHQDLQRLLKKTGFLPDASSHRSYPLIRSQDINDSSRL